MIARVLFRLWSRLVALLRSTRPRSLLDRLADPQDVMGQLLLDDVAGPALVIDRNGRMVCGNTALRQMFARTPPFEIGATVETVFTPATRDVAWDEIHRWLLGLASGDRSFAAALTSIEGGQEVRATVLPLREPGRGVTGALLRFADITPQRQLEAQLAHSQKLQATGQLAGGIAHDFNNLLTAIIGAVDEILEREQAPATAAARCRETVEDARQIRSSAERGAALVRQLLAFGRQQTLQPRALSVNQVIDDVSKLLRRLLGGAVRLDVELEKPGRMVRADPGQLDQVLINLAVNARNAMPHGGVLTLRSGHITLFRPLAHGVETIPPGRYVMIEVQDTGEGIPPEILPRIFDPFFTTRREKGGSGLGLSTVHGIVRQSEGFLAVDSTPGAGTSVRIYLPRWDGVEEVTIPRAGQRLALSARPESALPATAMVTATPPSCRGTVLLVEDEDPVRRLAERALTRAGWNVMSADSGESALALLHERPLAAPPIDAVVTDMMMPGMDGSRLLGEVRDFFRRPGLPCILVSGYAESELRCGLSAGGAVFLAKPYGLAQLVDALRDVVETVPA